MSNQVERLRREKTRGEGPKEIFGEKAKEHDASVNQISKEVFEDIKKEFPNLEFNFKESISKKDINKKLNSIDSRLGVTILVENSSIKPDGGIIEVKDDYGKWHIILVCEAKHQGNDIENIQQGNLVGKSKNQEFMVAGNAIERAHKNINEIRNIMLDEKHFPYVLFLEGSNFLTEPFIVNRPDGTQVELMQNWGYLNRIDRLTAANYSLPINQNCCENIFIDIDTQQVMLQSVSIYTSPTHWEKDKMKSIMKEVAMTSIGILGVEK